MGGKKLAVKKQTIPSAADVWGPESIPKDCGYQKKFKYNIDMNSSDNNNSNNNDNNNDNNNKDNSNSNTIASRIPAARPEGSPFAARGILSF